jgi:N-methylhydantoinase B
MDIGGIGFGPDATDVFMEGLYIPFLKILEEGKVNETLMAMIRANTPAADDTRRRPRAGLQRWAAGA